MAPTELLRLSNLLSLSRVIIIPVLWYFLSQPDHRSAMIALAILIIAGISDGLDGYVARRLKQVSQTGMVLDPMADKILAGSLVILLVIYRGFPIWLAALILARDLIILAAAAVALRRQKIVVPSSLTGKYTFVSIVVLIACSVIRFEYGVSLMSYLVTVLILVSTINYSRMYLKVRKGDPLPVFKDKLLYKVVRVLLLAAFIILLLLELYPVLFK